MPTRLRRVWTRAAGDLTGAIYRGEPSAYGVFAAARNGRLQYFVAMPRIFEIPVDADPSQAGSFAAHTIADAAFHRAFAEVLPGASMSWYAAGGERVVVTLFVDAEAYSAAGPAVRNRITSIARDFTELLEPTGEALLSVADFPGEAGAAQARGRIDGQTAWELERIVLRQRA